MVERISGKINSCYGNRLRDREAERRASGAATDEAGRLLRVRGTQIGGLEDRPQRPLGRDGVLPYEVPMRADHAAEVLRPRALRARAEHQVADPLAAQLLRDRREPREGVNL